MTAPARAVEDWRAIDWDAPWYRGWQALGRPMAAACAYGAPLWRVLDTARSAPLRFVPAAERDAAIGYEQQVLDSGRCPTRDGWHDAFNGLCWQRFPRAKSALNRLHVQAAAHATGGGRGALRDALTLLDENGALVDAPEPLASALAAKDWQAVFVAGRPLWQRVRVELFGHALLDRLRQPHAAITAHVLRMPPGLRTDADIDAWLADRLAHAPLSTRDFLHLPLLGVPGWWPGNAEPGFYDDTRVFRPPRAAPPAEAIPHPLRAYAGHRH